MGKGTRLSSSRTINGDILGLAFNGQSMSSGSAMPGPAEYLQRGDVRSNRFAVVLVKPSCQLIGRCQTSEQRAGKSDGKFWLSAENFLLLQRNFRLTSPDCRGQALLTCDGNHLSLARC